MLNIIYLIID